MNTLPTLTALERINSRLITPISRQAFEQSLRPLMAQRGDAAKHGGTWLFSSEYL